MKLHASCWHSLVTMTMVRFPSVKSKIASEVALNSWPFKIVHTFSVQIPWILLYVEGKGSHESADLVSRL